MSMKVYGINNCDTVKKVLDWLKANKLEYSFHNFKTDGITKQKLDEWIKINGWETVINLKSATYRKLINEGQKEVVDKKTAVKMMLLNTSTIKRPVIEKDGILIVGYNPLELNQILNKNKK